MEQQDEHKKIIDYFEGNIPPKEKKDLDNWLSKNPEREINYKEICKLIHIIRWSREWNTIDEHKAYQQITKRLHTKKLIATISSYAAIILVFITIGIILIQKDSLFVQKNPLIVEIQKETNVPILTLSNGQKITLSNKPQNIIGSNQNINIKLQDSIHLEYTLNNNSNSTAIYYNTLTVPKGCEFSITLSDGSKIWMNAESELRYPEKFQNGKRDVYLKGEAYFEVTHNPKNPFIVHTKDMDLKVLGTNFNINAYPEEKEIITTLFTGCISQQFANQKNEVILQPSQQSIYSLTDNRYTIQNADAETTLGWKNGKFIIRNERLENIMQKLNRWYHFQVVYTNPSLKDMRFHIHCERYKNIMTILNQLQETHNIHFNYHNGTIYVSK